MLQYTGRVHGVQGGAGSKRIGVLWRVMLMQSAERKRAI